MRSTLNLALALFAFALSSTGAGAQEQAAASERLSPQTRLTLEQAHAEEAAFVARWMADPRFVEALRQYPRTVTAEEQAALIRMMTRPYTIGAFERPTKDSVEMQKRYAYWARQYQTTVGSGALTPAAQITGAARR